MQCDDAVLNLALKEREYAHILLTLRGRSAATAGTLSPGPALAIATAIDASKRECAPC